MTRDIAASDRVVELGPGTGVFTRALLARGVPSSRLTVVEANPDFVDLLNTRFHDLHVVCANAATDSWQLLDHTEIDAVISGLPLLSMSVGEVSGVLSTAFALLRPQGRFYQFTYGPTCPVRSKLMKALRLRATRVGWTPRNLPPASVYRIDRRPE
jgi:phospholipid N-methyltransferase